MAESPLGATILAIAAIFIFRAIVGKVLQRKLNRMVGHQLLANALTTIFSITMIIAILYAWGVIQPIVEFLIAFSAITAVILFTVKDIWVENLFAGISMIGDKTIKVGTEVEIKGKTGKIVEMTLTVTKIKDTGGNTVIVPNRLFRQEAFVVKSAEKTT
ncbi:MAG: mechanosensitive ion channel domain-containing protein [Candidatus Hadarchaeota archaeon]